MAGAASAPALETRVLLREVGFDACGRLARFFSEGGNRNGISKTVHWVV